VRASAATVSATSCSSAKGAWVLIRTTPLVVVAATARAYAR
jgi:hypothetical protein